MNNNWLEVIYYTIIQLVKVNYFNLLIIVAFLGYLLSRCLNGSDHQSGEF